MARGGAGLSRWHNHTGNQHCNPRAIVAPGSLGELVELVRLAEREGTTVRAVGAGHSWSDVALTDGYLVEPRNLSGLLDLDDGTLRDGVAPVRFDATVLVGLVKGVIHPSWHLIPLLQIENGMENGIVLLDLDDRPVGKYTAHAGGEDLPLLVTMKIVAHEESTAQKVLAQFPSLGVGQVPVADLDAI